MSGFFSCFFKLFTLNVRYYSLNSKFCYYLTDFERKVLVLYSKRMKSGSNSPHLEYSRRRACCRRGPLIPIGAQRYGGPCTDSCICLLRRTAWTPWDASPSYVGWSCLSQPHRTANTKTTIAQLTYEEDKKDQEVLFIRLFYKKDYLNQRKMT